MRRWRRRILITLVSLGLGYCGLYALSVAAEARTGSGTASFKPSASVKARVQSAVQSPKVQQAVGKAKVYAASAKGQAAIAKIKARVAGRNQRYSPRYRPHTHYENGPHGYGYYEDPPQSHAFRNAFLIVIGLLVLVGVVAVIWVVRPGTRAWLKLRRNK